MFASSALGMYGIISLLLLLLVHMASLRSLGVPYLSPLAPLNIRDIYNNLMHAPATLQKYRPSFLEVQNPVHTSKSSEHIIPKNIGGTE
jgi:spore germination protein KA/spore germination protein